jgi:transcriptional regulator GlxA family with amidase domain
LLTAKTTQEDKLKGLENQADDYLVKPFNTRELKVRIKNLILQRQQLQEKFSGSVILKPTDIEVSSMEQVFLEKLMHLLEENLSNEGFGVEQLSEEMGMRRVHLHRKLQALTNHSPSQFIRRFRLQRAMDLLQKNAGTIAEIAYTVGFSSPTYFTKCFTEQYGYPPKEVKAHQTL